MAKVLFQKVQRICARTNCPKNQGIMYCVRTPTNTVPPFPSCLLVTRVLRQRGFRYSLISCFAAAACSPPFAQAITVTAITSHRHHPYPHTARFAGGYPTHMANRSNKNWEWVLNLDPEFISPLTIRQAYQLDKECTRATCKRNCPQKPKCIFNVGE
jgi:hypothetical protein